jgi:multimeric flavodoxin WrbA
MAEPSTRTMALGLVGSPIRGGNVDLLVDRVLAGAASQGVHIEKIFLNDLTIRPCQSCGPGSHSVGPHDVGSRSVDPHDGGSHDMGSHSVGSHAGHCRIDDDMRQVHALLDAADILILGTPVYFDTVSAQMKLMIDRCNCMTPLVERPDGTCAFAERPAWRRRAVLVAVAGSRQQFRTLRVTVNGFLKWVGAELVEQVLYAHDSTTRGGVRDDPKTLQAAFLAGVRAVGQTRT